MSEYEKDFWKFKKGITVTNYGIYILEFEREDLMGKDMATIFCYEPNTDPHGLIWHMGKAEKHYRANKHDKHARRWIRRHMKNHG